MTIIGGIGFTAPWLLVGLAALPVLWLILRAVPPAPIRRRFPGVVLLLGLSDDETVSDRTPWWLLLLRILAVAAIILGLAGPVFNPKRGEGGTGPLLIALDASWAGAGSWKAKMELLEEHLTDAGRAGRPVAVMSLTDPEVPVFQSAEVMRSRLPGLAPRPWQAGHAEIDRVEAALSNLAATETRWLSDGLDYPGRNRLISLFESLGPLQVYETGASVTALAPAEFKDGLIGVNAARSREGVIQDTTVLAIGRDPAGVERVLSSVTLSFDTDATTASAELSLPSELRGRITRFEIQGTRSAGSVTLSDDSLKRREVALIAGREDREGLELLSPLHYLEQALEPTADLLRGGLFDILPANPDVIVLADVAILSQAETEALLDWVDAGGMLLRFAGPRLAASDISRDTEDPLMPVRLRAGGRSVGGAMSWGEPKALAPFAEGSPFFGLAVPQDVTVSAQVMAQPDPTLADRVAATLSDGTPLVTRKAIGRGQVVLFHVTANAEWSTLPLSGLFVEMLERLAVSSSAARPDAGDLEGTVWQPVQVLDGFGALVDAGNLPGVDGPALVSDPVGATLQPGAYMDGDRLLARNVIGPDTTIAPADWPSRIAVEGLETRSELPLAGLLLGLSLLLLLADVVASLALSGRLRAAQARGVATIALVGCLGFAIPAEAQTASIAGEENVAVSATSEVVLAHVLTGDTQLDSTARAGLRGLSDVLFFRTSVEPNAPIGVDLERDELAFFPLLYWPITPSQPTPSADAYARLNAYLRSGGMILFDTRDANISGFGTASPNGRKLQELAAALDIPPLEPIPADHVVTRTFYLLQDFPGRHSGREVWVEAAPPDAEQIEGMPFRNLNDGVTPVVIGGNDWAAAWATDAQGRPSFPVGRGYAGERQREIAYRFGVNLIMYVLTGNYKSDQVHVPALLDRLGQ